MEQVPYVVYDERVPEWNMKIEEIRYILMNSQNKESDFIRLLNYLCSEIDKIDLSSRQKIIEILSIELYKYLQEFKRRYLEANPLTEEAILNLSKKQDVLKIGSILKSTIFFDILLLSDGSKTTGQIAKHLKKSVATISAYNRKLKELGFIRRDTNGKIKRNIKCVNINFELGF